MTGLKVTWPKGGFRPKMGAALTAAKIAATKGVRLTGESLKSGIRSQVTAAGLGTRVANTVRSVSYPKGGKTSLRPAATVFFKAPHIIRAFSEGAVIHPTGGRRMLAIPTADCPRGPRNRRLRPAEAEARFGEGDAYRTPGGTVLLSFFVVGAKSGKGWRKATVGRAKKGREGAWIPFYTLIPMARLPRRIDLEGALARAGADLPANIAAAWPREVQELE